MKELITSGNQMSNNGAPSLHKKCPCSELFWSASFPHFPAFGLNAERYRVSISI